MAKHKSYKLPRARIAQSHRGLLYPFALWLRPLTRLRVGKSELAAVSIAGSIVLVTGLMLAAFGAANQHGLSEQYSSAAPAAAPATNAEQIRTLDDTCAWTRYCFDEVESNSD